MQRDSVSSGFEDLVQRALARDVSPTKKGEHLTTDVLLGALASEMSPHVSDHVYAHLARCELCAKRHRQLGEELRKEQGRILLLSDASTLPGFMSTRWQRMRPLRIPSWGVFSPPRKGLRLAYALVFCSVLALAVSLGILLPHTADLAYLVRERDSEVAQLGEELASLEGVAEIVRAMSVETLLIPQEPTITPQQLTQLARLLNVERDFGAASALLMGYLRSQGVPLWDNAVAFENTAQESVIPNDSWESVANRVLGSEALWPVILLLNLNLTEEGEFPSAASQLIVPQSLKETLESP